MANAAMPTAVAAAVPMMMGRSEPRRLRPDTKRQVSGQRHHDRDRDRAGGALVVDQEVDRRRHSREGRRADDRNASQARSDSHRAQHTRPPTGCRMAAYVPTFHQLTCRGTLP